MHVGQIGGSGETYSGRHIEGELQIGVMETGRFCFYTIVRCVTSQAK